MQYVVVIVLTTGSTISLYVRRLLNHFPNHFELTRKDLMVKNIKRYIKVGRSYVDYACKYGDHHHNHCHRRTSLVIRRSLRCQTSFL